MTFSASETPASCDPSGDSRPSIAQAQRRAVDSPSALSIAGTIVSQTALITALLYYFGWVRAQSTLAYFGLDTSLVGYSTADYLLRSINVAFTSFIRVALAALVLLGLHRLLVQRALERPAGSWEQRAGRWIIAMARMIAATLVTAVIIRMLVPDQIGWPSGLALPLLLVMSVGLLGYVTHVRTTYPDALAVTPPSHPRARALVLVALGLLGALWAVGLYADQVGTRIATDIVADLPERSAVVVYSVERIAIAGTGMEVSEIAQPGSRYRYQYSGIRLLTRSADKYLLLPVGWQRGRDRVFLVRDDDSIRIDIAARKPA